MKTKRIKNGNKLFNAYPAKEMGYDLKGKLNRVDYEITAIDMVADIFHLVASKGFDPENIARIALMHYRAENND